MRPEAADILLVEDEAAPGRTVVSELSEAGHRVRWVRTMRDARVELKERPPDLLVLDLTLETDGLELLQALRFSPAEPRAGIVILADVKDVPARERAQQLGAAAVITKPIKEGEMTPVVRELLSFI
jgi:DNA-binding response OmpR family regulator